MQNTSWSPMVHFQKDMKENSQREYSSREQSGSTAIENREANKRRRRKRGGTSALAGRPDIAAGLPAAAGGVRAANQITGHTHRAIKSDAEKQAIQKTSKAYARDRIELDWNRPLTGKCYCLVRGLAGEEISI